MLSVPWEQQILRHAMGNKANLTHFLLAWTKGEFLLVQLVVPVTLKHQGPGLKLWGHKVQKAQQHVQILIKECLELNQSVHQMDP